MSHNQEIAIFGYSGTELVSLDFRDKYKMVLHQWGLIRNQEQIESINEDKGEILHTISTVEGQSGSPILLIDQGNEMSIIGLHKGGIRREETMFNVGRLVTQEMV